MNKKEPFVKNRIRSIGWAFKGAWMLLKNESSIKVQAVIAVLSILMGFYFDISKTEWMFQILAIGLVMGVEGVNTAAEEIANFIHPEYHKKIGYIKDVAAGAVFFAAIAALVIAGIIYLPKILTAIG